MGNVVSSLMMYALQAAWFCQRLIDQDFRQNHGSRSKPIMDIDEIDLDTFLSKCRSYYMSKNKRNSQLKYEQSPVTERTKKKWVHHRNRIPTEDSDISSSSNLGYNRSTFHGPKYTYLNFESEGFLSTTDQEIPSRQTDFTRLIMNENDFDSFLSNPCEISKKRENTNERKKSVSSKTKKWKRKKSYYRERYNPKSWPDRTVDAFSLPREAALTPNRNEILAVDSKDIDSASRDDCLNLDDEDLGLVGHGKEKRDPDEKKGSDGFVERATENAYSPVEESEMADNGFVLIVKSFD